MRLLDVLNRSLDTFVCKIHNILLGPIRSGIGPGLSNSLIQSFESSFSGDFASIARVCVALCLK